MSTPYIGSKISLISRLDIRYEGTLFQVDPVESTISLSQVRSFGTEDRPAPVPVPARAEVYDFIIFKASDIKDLLVCEETPKEQPSVVDITYDPAIVSVSKPPATDALAPQPPQQQSVADQLQRIADDKASQNSSTSPQPVSAQQQRKQPPPPAVPPPYIPPPTVPSAYQPPAAAAGAGAGAAQNQQPSYRTAVTGGNASESSNLSAFGQRPQRSFFNRSIGSGAETKQPQQQGQGFFQSLSNSNFNQQQQQQNRRQYFQPRQPLQQQQPPFHYQGNNSRRGGGPGGGGVYQQQQQSGTNRPSYQQYGQQFRGQQQQQFFHPLQQRFDGDFDFEKANQQFQTIGDLGDKIADLGLNEIEKVPSARGSGGSARGSEERSISTGSNVSDKNTGATSGNKSPVVVVVENFYDKNSSFFDNISCDALEREEGKNNRVDWKKERITNQETFGQMAVRTMMHHHHYYQRGGGGGGGRGGGGGNGPWSSSSLAAYRGGGGYNNYHNHPQQQHYYHHQQAPPQHRNHYHNNNSNTNYSNNRFGMQRQYNSGTASAQHQQQQQ